jgi:hypothetical protein
VYPLVFALARKSQDGWFWRQCVNGRCDLSGVDTRGAAWRLEVLSMVTVIGHVAKKELHQLHRDRRSLFLILVMPIVLTVLFGKALETGELRNIPLAILNLDGSPESNVIVTAFSTYAEIQIQQELATLEAAALLARGKIKAVNHFQGIVPDRVRREAQLQLLLDGTDKISAPMVEGGGRVIQRYNASGRSGVVGRGVRPPRAPARPARLRATEIRYNRPAVSGYVMPVSSASRCNSSP